MIFVFNVFTQILHLALVDCHSEILFGQKPFHERCEDLGLSCPCFQEAGQGLRSRKVLFLLNYQANEMLNIYAVQVTKILEFRLEDSFLDDFDSFLANVEACIFCIRTFENWSAGFVRSLSVGLDMSRLSVVLAVLEGTSKVRFFFLVKWIVLLGRIHGGIEKVLQEQEV